MNYKNEKKFDKLLNIDTRGTRESFKKHHTRYEGTPDLDLELLFNQITLNENDYLLDFGAGKGRVCIYANFLFNCYADGIEANLSTFHDSLLNLTDYYNFYGYSEKISFNYGIAEEYKIKKEHNVFFFFNPFNIHIFKQVLANINESLDEFPRKITIILAYPVIEYINFLISHSNFIMEDSIDVFEKKKSINKFLILTNQ